MTCATRRSGSPTRTRFTPPRPRARGAARRIRQAGRPRPTRSTLLGAARHALDSVGQHDAVLAGLGGTAVRGLLPDLRRGGRACLLRAVGGGRSRPPRCGTGTARRADPAGPKVRGGRPPGLARCPPCAGAAGDAAEPPGTVAAVLGWAKRPRPGSPSWTPTTSTSRNSPPRRRTSLAGSRNSPAVSPGCGYRRRRSSPPTSPPS